MKVNTMSKEQYFTMEFHGEGAVMVEPDLAVIHLGVETKNKELKVAQEENARIMQAILLSLRQLGIEEQDTQTKSYNINKQYDYVDGRQIDQGYVVQNIIQITLRDLSQVGNVIDTAVANGANVVHGISFEIEDPSLFYQQALSLALIDAEEKAMTLAKQMRVQVYPVPIRIVEESYGQTPFENVSYSRQSNVETPIEPGQNKIIAKINVIFSYSSN